jgi:hypothetical protein
MKFFILTIAMINGSTTYGYKFVKKKNCEDVGKNLVKIIKQGTFSCKMKRYVIE